MGKIRDLWRNLSLRKSIIFLIFAFAVLAILLSAATSEICYRATQRINASYPAIGEKYYLTNEQGERLGEGTYISKQITPMSEKDERLITVYNLLPVITTPVYSALCIIAAALLFYQSKLKEPLAKLRAALEKISDNDLDFQLYYTSRDEMGQLCSSFEMMRYTLARNFSEMWRQMEDRKQLNAAFAHDLRTPLTVLKGYNEMLQSSCDPATKDTAITMKKHILRLERYVDSMSRLRRLEDAQPNGDTSDLNGYLESLSDGTRLLCEQSRKKLCIQNSISEIPICIDSTFVSQVHQNLISNALRFARSQIQILYASDHRGLTLCVSDDGPGFSQDVLHKATAPYFTEEENRTEHFGLGLYICKLLCERHGGFLKIENGSAGAKVTAFFKTVDKK